VAKREVNSAKAELLLRGIRDNAGEDIVLELSGDEIVIIEEYKGSRRPAFEVSHFNLMTKESLENPIQNFLSLRRTSFIVKAGRKRLICKFAK